MTDYTNPPWNVRLKETKTEFNAPRVYWCLSYKGFRLCSELNYASEETAMDAVSKYIEENLSE